MSAVRFDVARAFTGGQIREDVAVLVVGGVVREVSTSRAAVSKGSDVEHVDLGDVVLAPAFVDAHAHLELSGLLGRVPPGNSFADWIRGVIAARGSRTPAEMVSDARAGVERLLATGTTLVGDIDSTGAIVAAARGTQVCVRRFREALDAGDAARAPAVLARVREPDVQQERFFEGLSPHAPYTISAELWSALGRLAQQREWPVAIHFAETLEEGVWLEQGSGPFTGLLAHSPRTSGLDVIERAGLLGARTLLIHANHASRGERERIRASGATVVHCPGTHRYFARERFDAEGWLALGVPLALGTDSLASNEDLDMGRELTLFSTAHPGVAPEVAFETASKHGAAALGFAGTLGVIEPGARADFVTHDVGATRGRDALAAIVHGESRRIATYVAGVPARPAGAV